MKKREFEVVSSCKERFIWFEGEINLVSARQFIQALNKLNKKISGNIFVYISGRGGLVYPCFDMMGAIENSKNSVFCVAHGEVSSSSFLLIQGARVGYRFAVSGAKLGFHRAINVVVSTVKAGAILTQDDYIKNLKTLELLDAMELAILFRRSSKKDEIMKLQKEEATIGVAKAKRVGIIDGYFDKKDFLKDRRIARALIRHQKSP